MQETIDLKAMQLYFETGITRTEKFRRQQLQALKKTILKYEVAIGKALFSDLGKSTEEGWITETGFLLSEINYALRHLAGWMDRESISTSILNIPSRSFIMNEPLGVVLIIGPWNYPLQLLFTPLVGAIAAGNCVVLKSSEFAASTSAIMKQIVAETFPPNLVQLVEGDGGVVVPELMNRFTFDHIFYTGSTAVGKLVYEAAASKLVPVTLELGGKSPCIVEADADVPVTAKRIAATKFSNAGQMCVAPDYVLVHHSKKAALVSALKLTINKFFGDDPSLSHDYGRIVNEKQFDRLAGYINESTIACGGRIDRSELYIEPTIVEGVSPDDAVMKEEIFGPILPIIGFETMEDAKKIIAQHKNPLACYIFTSSKAKETAWLNAIPFGGGCINNAAFHLFNHEMPFGGRGFSGSGRYHGKFSFDTFSHKKGVMKTPTWFDPSMKYPPYKGKLNLFKWLVK
ncbi:MAG: aldehyde dehydrogenase family protein [Ferruginibacter sp.]|nr:aldehyde dehydrogenase family protein [Ferruginibacter sp.]